MKGAPPHTAQPPADTSKRDTTHRPVGRRRATDSHTTLEPGQASAGRSGKDQVHNNTQYGQLSITCNMDHNHLPPDVVVSATAEGIEMSIRYRGPNRSFNIRPGFRVSRPGHGPADLCDECQRESTQTNRQTTNPRTGDRATETPPPTYTDTIDLSSDDSIPAPAAAAEAAAPTDPAMADEGSQPRTQENRATPTQDMNRHAAHEVNAGADFRLLQASRVSTSLFLFCLLLPILPALGETTTSQVKEGIILIEGDHHPLQIRAVTERYDLKPLTEASNTIKRLEELANTLDAPSVHPITTAATVCPTFGGAQSLQDPVKTQASVYESDGATYSGFVPVELDSICRPVHFPEACVLNIHYQLKVIS